MSESPSVQSCPSIENSPCGFAIARARNEGTAPDIGMKCELRTLSASQLGTLIALLAAMGVYIKEAIPRLPANHKDFFAEFSIIFVFTTVYFFLAEWVLEEYYIHELRTLRTPELWNNLLRSTGELILNKYFNIPAFCISLACYALLLQTYIRRSPIIVALATLVLSATISIAILSLLCRICKTFSHLEFFLRVSVVVTLAISIGLPATWIPIVHNPIDWGFVVMGAVYLLFLVWDAIIAMGTPEGDISAPFFIVFLVDAIAGFLVLVTIWGHVAHHDVAQIAAAFFFCTIAIGMCFAIPQVASIFARVGKRTDLR